ncbi:MAG: DciA family protein [Acidimicrobiia bacterium]
MSDPEPLEFVLESLLAELGLPAPSVSKTLENSWDQLAGSPWAGQTRPLFIREGELVVEAVSPALAGILRYAIGDLLKRLDEGLGEGTVETIRVVGPVRR